jgi:hypothetical protein
MPRGLSDTQIELVTRRLLGEQNRVTVRDVMRALRQRFAGCGRTERVCRILKQLEAQRKPPSTLPAQPEELEALRALLRAAQERAALSEERERLHQDLWAARYAEKVAQLEQQPPPRAAPAALVTASGITHDQYLRVYQRAADLARRLAKYEDPDRPSFE